MKILEKRKILALPKLELAEIITKETDLLISSEIMMTHIQLLFWEQKNILKNNVMIWNPTVEQLGWHVYQLSQFAKRNGWKIGIKHEKLPEIDPIEVANHPDYKEETTLEKFVLDLTTYIDEHVTIKELKISCHGFKQFQKNS